MENIGLIGFGCVGQGFYGILRDKYPSINVKKVVVKNPNKSRPEGIDFSFDVEDVLYDPKISVVVEAIDDAKAAFIYAKKILEQGKTLITANKKMVAENLPDLGGLLKDHGGKLYYEAAVCGSIPIIQNIKRFFVHEEITSVRGILNGSTNYILTLMGDKKLSYTDALQDAQKKGFAESDPTLDVEGVDAANKLTILCYETFGTYFHPQEIDTTGITGITPDMISHASKNGKKIKLVAQVALHEGVVQLKVQPEILGQEDFLYFIDNEFNSVIIEGKYSGAQQLSGRGAGSHPTGLAVVSDTLEAIRNEQKAKVLA